MSKINLIQGDCLGEMPKLDSGSIDLTVTSPAYDNLRTYNGNNALWGEHVWKGVIEELYRLTKDGGVVVWVVGDATIKGSETGTSFKQALYAKEVGFNLHDTMIYQKKAVGACGSKNGYNQSFEYMFVFCKGKINTFNPIKDLEPKNAGKKTNYAKNRSTNNEYIMETLTKVAPLFSKRQNVWVFNIGFSSSDEKLKQSVVKHPAKFPEKLANDHIISWSNEGDTVFDPFMGSGTTGKMAIQNKRKFIGIELDKEYFKIAQERINASNHGLIQESLLEG